MPPKSKAKEKEKKDRDSTVTDEEWNQKKKVLVDSDSDIEIGDITDMSDMSDVTSGGSSSSSNKQAPLRSLDYATDRERIAAAQQIPVHLTKFTAKTNEGKKTHTFFWDCAFNRIFPGFGSAPKDGEERRRRVMRKELWNRFGQPMHFFSLDFEKADPEYNFQMDSTRRNKRWVRNMLIARFTLEMLIIFRGITELRWFPTSQPNGWRRTLLVFAPILTTILYILQYLQVIYDTRFVNSNFTFVTFFWGSLQVFITAMMILVIAPRSYPSSVCDLEWMTLSEGEPADVQAMFFTKTVIIEWIIRLLITLQIVFRIRFVFFFWFAGVILLSFTIVNVAYYKADSPCRGNFGDYLTIFFACVSFLAISYSFEQMQRKDFIQASAVILESTRSEQLLENVLPKPIVKELKMLADDQSIVRNYESVSVLFADIVSFTTMSARLEPKQLVDLLDRMFLGFDRLADEHHLEKIKTIGDCYMCAGGIPIPNETHPEDIALMGLSMIELLGSGEFVDPITGAPLRTRVGIHTGPAVAGIIGNKKFLYDLWGDAVNTASRMESHGEPMRVHCSADTYALLKGQFAMEDRGVMNVKGKGVMNTYFVVRHNGNASRHASMSSVDDEEMEEAEDVGLPIQARRTSRNTRLDQISSSVATIFRAVSTLGIGDSAEPEQERSATNRQTKQAPRRGAPRSARQTFISASSSTASAGLGSNLETKDMDPASPSSLAVSDSRNSSFLSRPTSAAGERSQGLTGMKKPPKRGLPRSEKSTNKMAPNHPRRSDVNGEEGIEMKADGTSSRTSWMTDPRMPQAFSPSRAQVSFLE